MWGSVGSHYWRVCTDLDRISTVDGFIKSESLKIKKWGNTSVKCLYPCREHGIKQCAWYTKEDGETERYDCLLPIPNPTHTPLFPSLLYYMLVLFNLMLLGWREIKKSRGKEMTKIYLKMSTFHFQELFILFFYSPLVSIFFSPKHIVTYL